MLYRAKNGCVKFGRSEMNYAAFGYGERNLIILPGLSDGLVNVKGKALFFAPSYRIFFAKYRVYMFSRKNDLPEGYTIADMADDQAEALRVLGIEKTSVLGVSQGGMIALSMAVRHPDLTDKLIAAVSGPAVNDLLRMRVEKWIRLAEQGDYKQLMIDTTENSYSEKYLKKYRRLYPLIGMIGKPSDYRRFLVNADAILHFDESDQLKNIQCPVLIIGGAEDKIIGIQASYDLHEMIPGSQLHVYPDLGHAAYDEAPDFNARIFRFLEDNER